MQSSRPNTLMLLVVTTLAGCSLANGQSSKPNAVSITGASGCQFQSVPGTPAAFCETFDAPAGIGNRSGDLNGTIWGVSRKLGNVNYGQNQYYDVAPTMMERCGETVQVLPPHDVAVCNGQLVEAQNDQQGVTSLAMYPKQPFDIAGRTGTIAFDVSDDSHGSHAAWPEIWYTDQPVPTPFNHFTTLLSVPRNGFGVRFDGYCPGNQPGCSVRYLCPDEPADAAVITVGSAVVVNNYVINESFSDVAPGTLSVKPVSCVSSSSGPGNMNHFELRVSQNEIDVYGTDAGKSGPLKEIAIITNAPLSLTRGLVWLEDVHYNGNKDGDDQGTHTFTWDNVAFDGPVLGRDLAFDVPDNQIPVGVGYPGLINLGWPVGPNDSPVLSLNVPGVYNISQASGALLTFNSWTINPVNFSYQINNGAWNDVPWPFGSCGTRYCDTKAVAIQVQLADVQPGTNKIQIKTSDQAAIANVDLVLQGAGGTCSPTCPITTATDLVSSENPANIGDVITLTSTVTSTSGGITPVGSVTFSDAGSALGSVAIDASATATLKISSLTVGTHTLMAAYGGSTGFAASTSATLSEVVSAVPPTIRFDWEDGGVDGWSRIWGQSLSLVNSTSEAYTGTHSLRLNIASADTHPAIANEIASQLVGVQPGTMITLFVYNAKMTGTSVYPFAFDENWLPTFGRPVALGIGWNKVLYIVPSGFKLVKGIGIQIDNPNLQSGYLYLDSVSTL